MRCVGFTICDVYVLQKKDGHGRGHGVDMGAFYGMIIRGCDTLEFMIRWMDGSFSYFAWFGLGSHMD